MRLFRASLFTFIAVSAATPQTSPKPASASPATTIEMKGHHIGENVLEFLAVEKAGGKLTHCHDQLGDSMLMARAAELRQFNSRADTGMRCLKLMKDTKLQLAASGIDECLRLASAINGGTEKLGAKLLNMPLPGSASFDHGKLVEMELDFWNLPGNEKSFAGGYDAVLQDFIAKFGAPTKSWADDFQNAFGARFSYRRAAWETDSVTILLSELDSHNASSIMRDRVFFLKAAQDAAAKHQNVLDR